MEKLTSYCSGILEINGIKTFLISPDLLETVLSDSELLSSLFTSANQIRPMVNKAIEHPQRIFFAWTQHNVKCEKAVWQPVNCYKEGDFYHHVYLRDTWMCRECRHNSRGKFIKPIIELDSVFYVGTTNKHPPIPTVFKRRSCDNCGRMLQGYFASVVDE